MTDETRNLVTRRSALGLMGIGAVGVASETLGFTNVTAGRDALIGIDGDGDALLELRGDSSDDGVDTDPLSDLEGETVDDDLTIQFTNNSNTTLEDASDDITVTIDGTDDTQDVNLSVDTSGDFDNDGANITGSGDSKTFNLATDVETSNTVSIELDEDADDEGFLTFKIEVTTDFGGTVLDLTRENITIQDTTPQ